ncbi:MAG TPA: hypothetical protein VFK44_13905 [Bacillales bacterium]|nr:hypothetical protein [Bacillales bacterium]
MSYPQIQALIGAKMGLIGAKLAFFCAKTASIGAKAGTIGAKHVQMMPIALFAIIFLSAVSSTWFGM